MDNLVGTSLRNQLGPLIRWPSANTANQRGGTPLLSPLPPPFCSVICVYCRVCICNYLYLMSPYPPPPQTVPKVTSFTRVIWKVYNCPRSKISNLNDICSSGDKLNGAPGVWNRAIWPYPSGPSQPALAYFRSLRIKFRCTIVFLH